MLPRWASPDYGSCRVTGNTGRSCARRSLVRGLSPPRRADLYGRSLNRWPHIGRAFCRFTGSRVVVAADSDQHDYTSAAPRGTNPESGIGCGTQGQAAASLR